MIRFSPAVLVSALAVTSAGCSDRPAGGASGGATPATTATATRTAKAYKVAIIDYPQATSVQDRVRGFEGALGKSADITIVAKQPGGGVRDQAATTMENILQAHPDLDAVFGINDNSALGALSVLEARGRKDVIVVGFDADPEGREAIRKGRLLADAIQYPKKIGAMTIATAVKHLDGKPVPKQIPIETGVLDAGGLETAKPGAGEADLSGETPASKPYTIGVTLLTKTHPFYQDLEAGLRGAADKLKVTLKVQAAEFDAAAQTSQIENFVTQKVDAIVMCPADSQTMGGAVKRANDAKIPVFTADIASKQGDIVCHIASDNEQGGRLIGEYLVNALHARKK